MATLERCALCRKQGTKNNRLNRHHVQGRKKGQHTPIMRVHSLTCHHFCNWVTALYQAAGRETELDERRIIYLYQRSVNLRHGDGFVLPTTVL